MFCRDKSKLVATKVLSWQAYFCCDKHMFVTTKHIFCRNKSMLVVTKPLSWQTCLSQQKLCLGKHTFVAAKDVFCCNRHVFVMAKIILVAAPPPMIVQIRDSALFLIGSWLGIADCIPKAFLCLGELDEQGVLSLWSCLSLKVHEGNSHTRQSL